MSGKIIIVTGGNGGLGFESVKVFAEKGANVILTSRSIEKGEKAKQEIGNVNGTIEVMELDLQDFKSIEKFSEEFKRKYDKLDVLLNNAGISQTPYFLTKDGLEGQMGVNHFGHFKLTGLLMDVIKKTPQSRVVNLSSGGHKYKSAKMDFDNLLYENGKDYSPMGAYCRSKLAILLFTYELDRKFKKHNIDSISVAAHPGGANTNLLDNVKANFFMKGIMKIMVKLFVLFGIAQTPAQGALSEIRASVDENVKGGDYYGPRGKMDMEGPPELSESSEDSYNEEHANKLWEISEKITDVKYF